MTLTIHELLALIQGLSPSVPIVVRGAGSLEEFPVHVDVLGLNDPASHVRVVLTSEGVVGSSSQSRGFDIAPESFSFLGLTIGNEGIILAPGGAAVGTMPKADGSAAGTLDFSAMSEALKARGPEGAQEDDDLDDVDTSDASSLGGTEAEKEEEAEEEAENITGNDPDTAPSSEPKSEDEWADLDQK